MRHASRSPGASRSASWRTHERDLGSAAQEVVELHDHLAPRRELDLAAQVLGALDEHLAHARIAADALQQAERLARRSGARGASRASPTSAATSARRGPSAPPGGRTRRRSSSAGSPYQRRVGVRQRHARGARTWAAISSPTLRQSVSLPPKMLTWRVGLVDLDDVLARELHPVGAVCPRRSRPAGARRSARR